MLPRFGPSIWKVPFSDGLALPVAPAAGSPSISAELRFDFPKSAFIVGLLALPLPDVAFATYQEQIAQLAIAITDETNQPIVSNTRGTLQGTTFAPAAASLLTLFGRSFRRHALQRPVASLDRWLITFQNRDTVRAQVLEGLYLYLEEADR